jgi:hypothetical protein
MANASNPILPTDLGWVHELAKNELNPESQNIFNAVNQFDPKQIIEESTIEFLEELRDLFTIYSKVFNNYAEQGGRYSEVKLYGVANTPADFMLFRNNIKLVFSNTAHGIISATFIQHSRGGMAVDGSPLDQSRVMPGARDNQDIIAQLGPFLDVKWTFQSEPVNPDRLVKYYFVEFVKASRVAPREASSNQQLLKQIKALLQDKGIEL